MNKTISLTIIITLTILAGCRETKEEFGTLVGAGTGAYIGSQIGSGRGQLAAVAIGALLGGHIGGGIGRDMDELDRRRANNVLEKAPTGTSVSWDNPDTNSYYTVTPTRTYADATTGPCRDYTTQAVIGGKSETIYGTACRQADGTWMIQ